MTIPAPPCAPNPGPRQKRPTLQSLSVRCLSGTDPQGAWGAAAEPPTNQSTRHASAGWPYLPYPNTLPIVRCTNSLNRVAAPSNTVYSTGIMINDSSVDSAIPPITAYGLSSQRSPAVPVALTSTPGSSSRE